MTTTPALPRLHARLLYDLGGEIFALPLPISPDGLLEEVGTLAGLPVWGCHAPPNEFARMARKLATSGRLGLLIGSDTQRGRHLLAITLAPIRVIAIPVAEIKDSLACRRLLLASTRATDNHLERAVHLADALDVDSAGRKTFKLLHQLLLDGSDLLPKNISVADRHAWLLVQFTRLLFLRFVEAEGWLNNESQFLLTHFDRCLVSKRDPFKHFLQPLFFGTLNRPLDQRLRTAKEFGDIPFLNGGLFEPHLIEERHDLSLPTEYWQIAFASLAERIDVTLEPEATGGEVTPEMLGRVFEGVMDSAERKASGAFYTPAPLVRTLVKAALIPFLSRQLQTSEAVIDEALEHPDVALRRAMLGIRVLDPGVGSGAFLVGALDLLHGPGERHPARVRHLVTRSLFGIDRHPGAVRITELRLWLEVLRSLRGSTPRQIPPLPNLDAAIRAGDTLLDPLHGASTRRDIGTLSRQQRALATVHGSSKRKLLVEIRRNERTLMLQLLEKRELRLQSQMTDLIDAAQNQTLFGERSGLAAGGRRTLTTLRQEWLDARREIRSIQRDATAAPFACAVAFGPVIAKQGGFDLIVGNPPWVRAEKLPATTRTALSHRYRWWRGQASRGFQHQPDLAVAFVERSFELLRPGGTMSLLLPSKLATTNYATLMREGIVRRHTIHRVADLADDSRADFQATTYPMALIASKGSPPIDQEIALQLRPDAPRVPQSSWHGGGSWILQAPAVPSLLRRLTALHPLLRETLTPQLGVKTGANDLFLNPPIELVKWTRPTMRGRDVSAGAEGRKSRLLWPADDRGNPLPKLPATLNAYLEPHRAKLQRRTDLHDDCWWRLFRTQAATAPFRVVWSDLARQLVAVPLVTPEVVPLNSCYVVIVANANQARALSAWLNSSWLRAIARLNADPAAQGYSRFNARAVGDLPLPVTVLRDGFLASHLSVPSDPAAQMRLDEYTAAMLELTRDDRELLNALATNRR